MSDMVVILLATYNGEPFLREQIESLFAQTHKNLRILVRDDGSQDETMEILANYAATYPNIFQVMQGPNLGFVGNFLELIAAAPPDASAYFFCDQDDVWLPHKVESACRLMQKVPKGPVLYFGRLSVVDETLQPLHLSPLISRWSLGNALLESQMTGCTIALNTEALQLLQEVRPRADRIVAHDWWAYLVLSALGTLVYDPEPHILYRQHGKNSLGTPRSRWQDVQQRWSNFRQGRWTKRRPEPMVAHFLELYRARLSEDQVRLIEAVSLRRWGFWSPLWLYLKGVIWRQGTLNQGILLLMLLLPSSRKRVSG
ncbi:glycosyltransferase family 2 protein [Oligoflexus tunisiensis]|uniref:glycosyltransferase family 2 protein n=1 Tax=Oligoflexus tunisiensis TaxID=708132 RepID=UPI00114D1093|nr:glycosyltransferase family 2 protein [Oligoflexus tunisiensis]